MQFDMNQTNLPKPKTDCNYDIYDPPITVRFYDNMISEYGKEIENSIINDTIVTLKTTYKIDISQEALKDALRGARQQYERGFMAGYEAGASAERAKILDDLRKLMDYREKDVK
jgi:Na+-transporting NADH:ubiquinone oxidoreductase subunit NqrF